MLSLTPPRHTSTLRTAAGWSRREADIADRGLGRLNWAGSAYAGRLGKDWSASQSRRSNASITTPFCEHYDIDLKRSCG